MFLVCSGVGLLLVSYLLGIFRWGRFARSIGKQRLRDGGEFGLYPATPDATGENSPQVLYDEMIAAGRCLQEALDREQRLCRRASKDLNHDSAPIEHEARELVDRAAANYWQATQHFRASVQAMGIEKKSPHLSPVWNSRTVAD